MDQNHVLLKKGEKKSGFWHIYFLPKHVTSVYKWIYENKMADMYGQFI